MTQSEWLSATDPLGMVNAVADKLTDRRLRLFLVACCRRLWHLPLPPGLREAVEVAERFADGAGGEGEAERAGRAAWQEADSVGPGPGRARLTRAGDAAFLACQPPATLGSRFGRYARGSFEVMRGADAAAEAAALHAARTEGYRGGYEHAASAERGERGFFDQALAAERAEQCRLLRDVAGNPFSALACDPAWLSWNVGTVQTLARSADEERELPGGPLDPIRLALLADALEDAGCSESAILEHLRGPESHVRGCWAVDLVLGRG